MKQVQCRAKLVEQPLTQMDSAQLQARKKEWERQQKQQQLLKKVNALLGQHK